MINAFKFKYILFLIPIFFISANTLSNNHTNLIYAQSINNTLLTYQNSTYGITIKYPTGWSIDESGGKDDMDVDIVAFISPNQNDNAAVDLHQDKSDNDSTNIGSYLGFTTSSLKEELKDFKILESDTNSSLAGNNAYKVIYTYTSDDGNKMKDLETGTVIGSNTVYYVVYEAAENAFDKDLPVVQSMLNSLQIH